MPSVISPRKGRGAASNATGRFRGRTADCLRRRLGLRRCRAFAVQHDRFGRFDAHNHRPQRLARYRFRSVDQPLSRVRAWLHLLLCPAELCLSRIVARAGFRKSAFLQTASGGPARRGAAQTGLYLPTHRSRQQHRSLSAGRAPARDYPVDPRSAARFSPSGHDRQQIGADPARYRHP